MGVLRGHDGGGMVVGGSGSCGSGGDFDGSVLW